MQERKRIFENPKREEAYHENIIIETGKIEGYKKDYYEESMNALIQYMKSHDQNPSEKRWDQYAIYEKYLSSKTIGYLSGVGFNTLCRKLRKEINKAKRQIKD